MLKNNVYKIKLFLLLFVVITIFACRKDITNIFDKDTSTKWAENYFTTVLLVNSGNQVSYAISNKISSLEKIGRKPNMKTPMWVRARADKTNLYEFVEVPLLYTRKIIPIIGKKDEQADLEVLKASFDRLIIYKDKKGNISQRIISFIPDKAYLRRHNGSIGHNNINHLDKDFDGYLIYKTWDDKTVNRLRINNGKATSLSKATKQVSLKINSLATIDRTVSERFGSEGESGCEDWYHFEYEITCTYSGDNPVPIECDEPFLVSKEWIYTICPDDDPGGGGEPSGCEDPANFNSPECQPTFEPEIPLDSLIKKFCDNLTATQKAVIQNAVNSLKDYDCATKYIYNHFDNKNKSFSFCISSGPGSGAYSPTNESFNFTSNAAAANMYVMEHEFIHAFQDDSYTSGTEQYGLGPNGPKDGFVNIEFEQAVMNDMINYGNTTAFDLSSATQAQKDAYLLWISQVTNNGMTYPKLNPNGTTTEIADYNSFMSSYNSFLAAYNTLSGNLNHSTALSLSPVALIKLFNNINRNCP